jgi:hypothetical protein
MKMFTNSKLTIAAIAAAAVLTVTGATALASAGIAQSDLFSDENGTKYSADGGQTWSETPAEIPGFAVDETLNVNNTVETLTDGGEITEADRADAIFGGNFVFDENTLSIEVLADGTVITDADKTDVVFGGNFVFDENTNSIEVLVDGTDTTDAEKTDTVFGGDFAFDENNNDITVE